MTQTVLPPISPLDPPLEAQLEEIVARYHGARGLGMQLMTALGGHADSLIDRLPEQVRSALQSGTMRALESSFDVARQSRGRLPDTGHWLTRAMTMGTGAAGGLGGLPSALAELPVTTTIILRAIQGIAVEHGFDPSHQDTRADCLQVFAAAGPLTDDDGTDLGFLTLRLSVTGASTHKMIAAVAPKLSAVLGQKLASQTVPVLGAVAGAATNYVFTRYYQDMAHVHFGLRKLAETSGQDRAALISEFQRLARS